MQHIHAQAANASSMDQRSSDRFGIALPITMDDDVGGQTHDISETGVLFETERESQVGDRIVMTLLYSLHGVDHQLGCEAEVVRVQRVGQKFNVAVRLLTPLLSGQ